MSACKHLTKSMLERPIEVRVKDGISDFQEAKAIAGRKAAEVAEDPMLLAWFDKKAGEFSPKVECCAEGKPSWLVYAESRGGKIIVDINDEEYVFVYYGQSDVEGS